MPAPDRFAHCPAAGPLPESPRPVVTCGSLSGKRELRVRFVDAATNAPLTSGMLLRRDSKTGIVEADSLGALTISNIDTFPVQYLARARGYAPVADTVSVEPNSICNVLLRLKSARGYGF